MLKVGIGVDIHAFTAGDGLVLGGVKVPYHQSIAAHSDGDAVIHAMVDALLGAVGAGDIGSHFPSSDARWQDADSRLFLRETLNILQQAGATVNHVDCTVILQEPALAPHIPAMRKLLADDLGVAILQVSIKATTSDHLGFTGRQEGITAVAVATVEVSAP